MYDSLVDGKLTNLNWLFIDESVVSPKTRKKQKWFSDRHILCKIGFTTKASVSTRLLEWQNTCKHPVLNLTPDKVELLRKRPNSNRLSKMLQALSITEGRNKKETQSSPVLNLRTYVNGGFYTDGKGPESLQMIENAIHKMLWRKYGQGLIYCYGCDPAGNKRHKEWFNVMISDLPWLLKTIDSFCLGQKSTNAM